MIKINLSHSYSKTDEASGKKRIVFVFKLVGTTEELAAFKKDKQGEEGNHYREDDKGVPLYFSTRAYPNGTPLKKSPKTSKWNPDTTSLDAISNMVQNYGAATTSMFAGNLLGGAQLQPVHIEQTDPADEKLD